MRRLALIWIVAGLTTVWTWGTLGCGGDDDGGTPCPDTGTPSCPDVQAPNIAGLYIATHYVVAGSSCPTNVTQLALDLAAETEVFEVTQTGTVVDLHDPGGSSGFVGCVDASGAVSATDCGTETDGECTVTIPASFNGNLASTQGLAYLTLTLNLSSECGGTNCEIIIGFDIDRSGGAAAAATTSGGLGAIVQQVVQAVAR